MKLKINRFAYITTERKEGHNATVNLYLTATGKQISSTTAQSTDSIFKVITWAKNRINQYLCRISEPSTILGAKTIQFAPTKTNKYNAIFNN